MVVRAKAIGGVPARPTVEASKLPTEAAPEWLSAFLIEDWRRRLEAARKLASQRMTEWDAGFHRVHTVKDCHDLNARLDRIADAVERSVTAEVAYRRRESDKHRRTFARASRALFLAGETVPEHEGVELDALVIEAHRASEPLRLAVVMERIDFRVRGLIGREASRFARYYRNVKAKPARSTSARTWNEKRPALTKARYADARQRLLTMCLHEGYEIEGAITQLMTECGQRGRKHFKQQIRIREVKKQLHPPRQRANGRLQSTVDADCAGQTIRGE